MTKYILRFPKFFIVLLMALSFVVASSNIALAQYHGAYPGQKKEEEKKGPEMQVPQVFSSQVTSVEQTRKLDQIYDGLYVALWNYAISDFNYQKQLYELLENERFQNTRHSAEFTGTLKSAMDNLNENHLKMKKAVEDANLDYEYVKERVRQADKATLEELWPIKIAEYNTVANKYFKQQHTFLKTYKAMVAFILKQGGGYYFDSTAQTLKFYKLGAYDYYGKTLDKLHVISYEQTKLLKANAPANMDPDLLK